MEKWMVYAKKAEFERLGKKFNIDPVAIRVIRNRNIETDEEFERYLNPVMERMYSPWLMKDMEKAIDIIVDFINEKKKIRVIGDYDIDGVCSGHILTRGLEIAGGDVDFYVPDRIVDGYGINQRIIKEAYDDGVDLLVTCDNGIAAIEQIEYAKTLGMTVIVTDHHEIVYTEEEGERKYVLPNADAVINAKQPDCQYPFDQLCGGSVAYKLIEALFERIGIEHSITEKFLVFAGIATIGDVVDLQDENRIIASEGLKRIKSVESPGLQALINKTDLGDKKITSYHIGFILGPCLNAGGRLDTAMKAYRLLHTIDEKEADNLADELKNLNEERKELTASGVQKAIELVEEDETYQKDSVLVLYLPECHESIVGIIAGRIRERYNKPVFVLTKAKDGIKGSGRSIDEYNMFEKLVQVRHLFQKFGGHAMAAGISLDEEKLEELRYELNKNAELTEDDLARKVWIDVPMPFGYITEKLIEQLGMLEPFGKGNEKPVFAEKNAKVSKINIFGSRRNVIRLMLRTANGSNMEAIYFEDGDTFLDDMYERFGKEEVENALSGKDNSIKMSVIYYPEVNEFNGRRNIRVVIKRYL